MPSLMHCMRDYSLNAIINILMRDNIVFNAELYSKHLNLIDVICFGLIIVA